MFIYLNNGWFSKHENILRNHKEQDQKLKLEGKQQTGKNTTYNSQVYMIINM